MDRIDAITANIQILASSAPAGRNATFEILWRAYDISCSIGYPPNHEASLKNYSRTFAKESARIRGDFPISASKFIKLSEFKDDASDIREIILTGSATTCMTNEYAPEIIQAIRRFSHVFGQYSYAEKSFDEVVNRHNNRFPLIYGVRERFDQNYGLVRDIVIVDTAKEYSARKKEDAKQIQHYIIPLPTNGPDVLHR